MTAWTTENNLEYGPTYSTGPTHDSTRWLELLVFNTLDSLAKERKEAN